MKSHKPISQEQLEKLKEDAQREANVRQQAVNVRSIGGELLFTAHPQSIEQMLMRAFVYKPTLTHAGE